jgi:hypothetical protein
MRVARILKRFEHLVFHIAEYRGFRAARPYCWMGAPQAMQK